MNITKSKGVLSYEFNSYTLMNGSSNNCNLILTRSIIFNPDD